ncbi:exported hypothetical protein [Pseudomonas sp. 8Z]|nr:exported hypothetical protein [Pseudomonas sp. 8Z]
MLTCRALMITRLIACASLARAGRISIGMAGAQAWGGRSGGPAAGAFEADSVILSDYLEATDQLLLVIGQAREFTAAHGGLLSRCADLNNQIVDVVDVTVDFL